MSDLNFHLMSKHQRVDDELRGEMSRRLPDPIRVMQLKKLKLAIKDRLFALTRRRAAI